MYFVMIILTMRSKLLNKKTKSRLVKMAVMAGYVVMYYLTQYVAGIEAAKNMQVLTNIIQVMNGG